MYIEIKKQSLQFYLIILNKFLSVHFGKQEFKIGVQQVNLIELNEINANQIKEVKKILKNQQKKSLGN